MLRIYRNVKVWNSIIIAFCILIYFSILISDNKINIATSSTSLYDNVAQTVNQNINQEINQNVEIIKDISAQVNSIDINNLVQNFNYYELKLQH